MDFSKRFIVNPGQRVHLDKIDPGYTAKHAYKANTREEIRQDSARLRELQYLLYAENRRGLLICLQAMDTGGKDGAIRHVLGYMNPQSCRVHAFKTPTAQEAAHDFLWRIHKVAPARGEVMIFNRSHYEDVLVVRVHNLVDKAVWSARYDAINAFERHLTGNGVHILKFFLHISKEEQLRRFKKRLDDPRRQWKISEADYRERGYWDDYQRAYEDALSRCSTEHAPWFIIPADHKWFRNLAISRIVVEYLDGLGMRFPQSTLDLEHIREEYHSAEREAEDS